MMSTLQANTDPACSPQRDAHAAVVPAECRFTVALASAVMQKPSRGTAQSGYTMNLSKYENNMYGGRLDLTA